MSTDTPDVDTIEAGARVARKHGYELLADRLEAAATRIREVYERE